MDHGVCVKKLLIKLMQSIILCQCFLVFIFLLLQVAVLDSIFGG